MGFLCFCRTLVTALVAATFVQATPFGALAGLDMGLTRRDTYVVEQCKNLVYGNNRIPIGTVCVSLSGGCLTIKYTITSTGWSFQEVHAWAGTSVPTENAPGQFPYASGKGYPDKSSPPACTLSGNVYTCKVCNIPKEWRGCSGSLYIAAHAAVKGPGSQEETAWDDGTCYGRTQGNCPKYCEVHRECKCPVEYHYSPYTHTVCAHPPAQCAQLITYIDHLYLYNHNFESS
jgi:hypothetical protein